MTSEKGRTPSGTPQPQPDEHSESERFIIYSRPILPQSGALGTDLDTATTKFLGTFCRRCQPVPKLHVSARFGPDNARLRLYMIMQLC